MYLDILGKVTVEVRGDGSTLRNYLRHEYAIFEVQDPDDDPDLVINLVDDVASEAETVHVRGPVSYDDDGVYLQHRLPGEEPEYNAFRIDFDALGHEPCHVTCDSEFNPHFFGIIVDYLIHFCLLQYGSTYCHSCAFEYNGTVIVCPAWRQVGKTNLLLSFLSEDVTYIADDWCVLNEDGTVNALPKRLNLLYYNFKQYPELLKETPDEFQALVDFVNRANAGEFDLNQDAIDTLSNQARMRISPYDLFSDVGDGEPKPVDYFFFLRRDPTGDRPVTQQDLSTETFSYRKQSILEFEQSYFNIAYRVYKAQTGNVNPYLENAKRRTLDILDRIADKTPEFYELTAPSQRDSEDMKKRILETVDDGSE